jgi:RHS repeat-associated protein
MGRNVIKDGYKLIWDDYNIIVEDATSSNATFNIWGLDLDGTMQGAGGVGGLLAVQKGDAVYQPVYDANGNISEYVSSDGVIVAHYAYSSFGKLLMENDNICFTHRFSTKPYCVKTELVEFEFRKYSPNIGRWCSRDMVAFANQYQFVYNSVLSYYEFLGLYGNPVTGPGGINWGPANPYDPGGGLCPDGPDQPWYDNLPDCPCSIPIGENGCPDPAGAGPGWTSPSSTTHEGGAWEIRSEPNAKGAGQQCVYDSAGKLINDGPGAGTPDRISPSPNKVINDIKCWNHGGLIRSAKHFLADGWQWLFGTEFDHWTHPPNQGKDGNGKPCPPNDGSDAPPKKCNSCK